MTKPNFETTLSIAFHEGEPFIESRARPVGSGNALIPKGKMLVMRTPIFPPGTDDEAIRAATVTEIVDDDGDRCPFCP